MASTNRIPLARTLAERPTFADFIEGVPGIEAYARSMYLQLDADAARIGAGLAASRDTPDGLRAKAAGYEARGLTWLASINADLADALDIDVRRAALPDLYAWSQGPDGVGRTWVHWYSVLLNEHIAALAAGRDGVTQLEAAE